MKKDKRERQREEATGAIVLNDAVKLNLVNATRSSEKDAKLKRRMTHTIAWTNKDKSDL